MSKSFSVPLAVLIVVWFCLAPALFAQTEAGDVTDRVTSATIFKNGTVLIRQELKGTTDGEGWLRSDAVAPPVLGTLNTIAGEADQIVLEDIETVVPITYLPDLMEANIGKTILIPDMDKDGKKTYRAEKIISVLKNDRNAGPLLLSEEDRYRQSYYSSAAMPVGTLVVLQSDAGTRIVSIANFAEFMAQAGQEIVTTRKQKKTVMAIHLKDAKAKETTVVVEYLSRGLRWIPAYRLVLADKQNAELSLCAEVVNDLIDLKDSDVEFVGGFPHFLFDGQLSPLALTPYWPGFSQFITGGGTNAVASQVAYNSSPYESRGGYDAASQRNLEPLSGITTAESGDLHFYHLPKLTLLKGKRGMFALWKTTVPYEHGYVLEIDAAKTKEDERMRRENSGYRSQEITSEKLAEKVGRAWHVLNLRNTGKLPWTMGPATAFEDNRPLGQDILYFAAPGTETPLYVAPSPQVTYRYDEELVGRDKNVRTWQGYTYDLVKEKGTLKIANNKSEPIKLKLVFHRGGEITEVDNEKLSKVLTAFDGADWRDAGSGYFDLNVHTVVSGVLELKPGEEVVITLKRQYYQRG